MYLDEFFGAGILSWTNVFCVVQQGKIKVQSIATLTGGYSPAPWPPPPLRLLVLHLHGPNHGFLDVYAGPYASHGCGRLSYVIALSHWWYVLVMTFSPETNLFLLVRD